jgi:MoaA/NifB/PqqE/SkfB family radical SAM enzyme
MCDIWKNKHGNELDTQEWIAVLDRLVHWLGSFRLTITGGEPFMKTGIWDFLDHATGLGIPVVVVTNGVCFNRRTLGRLSGLRLAQVVLSIDGLDSEQHDDIRGVPGSFKRTWGTLEALAGSRRSFLLASNTVIMDSNVAQLGQIGVKLHEAGVDRIFFQPIQGGFTQRDGTHWPYDSALWPSDPVRVAEGLDALIEAKRRGVPVANSVIEIEQFREYLLQGPDWIRPFRCNVKYTTFHCDAYGEVRMCIPYAGNIGNVRNTEPAEIWTSARARQEREVVSACTKPCLLNCNRSYTFAEKVRYGRDLLERRYNR